MGIVEWEWDSLSMMGVCRHMVCSWNQYLSTSVSESNTKVVGGKRCLASLVKKEERGLAVDVSKIVRERFR